MKKKFELHSSHNSNVFRQGKKQVSATFYITI